VPHRYVVLWEIDSAHKARPIGLAVEQDGYVLVETPDDQCIPSRYDRPFTVAGPDLVSVRYTPANQQYFDHVVLDLSRAFVIGDENVVLEATDGVVLDLLREHVIGPLRRERVAEYISQPKKYPAINAYQQRHYSDASTTTPDPAPPARVPKDSLVAA
jgi:hypothetical protein